MRIEASDLGSGGPLFDQDELLTAIQNTLAALADVDTYFESELSALSEWAGPETIRTRIARELKENHERDRALCVRHLTALETCMRSMLKVVH